MLNLIELIEGLKQEDPNSPSIKTMIGAGAVGTPHATSPTFESPYNLPGPRLINGNVGLEDPNDVQFEELRNHLRDDMFSKMKKSEMEEFIKLLTGGK